ncbi:CvpA family protein [bacterium]
MSIIDVSVFILILGFASVGFFLGAIHVVFLFASIFVGSIVAAKFYMFGMKIFPQNDWARLFSFAIIFFISSFIIVMIGKLLSKFIKQLFLKPADRVLGMVLLVMIGFMSIGSVYSVANNFFPNEIHSINLDRAKTFSMILKFNNKLSKIFPSRFEKKIGTFFPKSI